MFTKGPSSRTRSMQRAYNTYMMESAGAEGCAFCSDGRVIVKEIFNEFRLLGNRFPYIVWDDYEVLEHLMLAPKRHVSIIADLNANEKDEYIELLGRYEALGYSIYSRAPIDVTRSVDHLHTHLMKIGNNQAKGMLYIRKPHFVKYFFSSQTK